MPIRIEVTPERDPNRIEGFCTIPSWPGEQSVIKFSRLGKKWMVASSIALPSNLDQAHAIKQCFDQAFNALESIQN